MDPSFPERAADPPEPGVRGKRGRKSRAPDPDEGPVANFAHELSQLKRAAGDPSYDRMRAEFGAAASKSALSAAARGQTLPSWETTWEFVRSLAVVKLGRDEQVTKNEWRVRWDYANSAELAQVEPEQGEPRPPEPDEAPGTTPRRRPSNRVQAGVAAILVALLGVILVGLMLAERATETSGPEPRESPDYPIPGDDSGFGTNGANGDVTVPDGSRFRVGDSFEKIWKLNNTGRVIWEGRYLQAFGDTSHVCGSPERVPIRRTEPGNTVDVTVPVTAKRPGFCHVEWKMVDANGRLFFPSEKDPVYYEVRIVE